MLKIITFGLVLFFIGCGTGSDTKALRNNSVDILENHIHINEVLSANANTNIDPDFKEFSDWIELYNDQNSTIDISGYHLSDSKKNPTKWKFPENTTLKPYSYILVWADGQNIKKDALHTNFKLSQKGERVILSDKNGDYIDGIKFSSQEPDISCVMKDDEIVYMKPTPKSKNSKTYNYISFSKKPTFSLKSGFYEGEQVVELKADETIYYTLDGSTPTTNSTLYDSSILIDKTTVIRAISVEKDKFASKTVSQTYLIDEDITLPVMSISMDEKYLYDDKIGIYKNFQEDWMRPANIEFIKDGESKFSEGVGVRIYGSKSKTFPIKSFSIFLKDRYGKSSLKYPLFIDKPQIEKVKSFILRNSGNDWKNTLIRDALTHSLAKDIGDIDYLSYEPVVAFVNGKYYGLLNLREKANTQYIESNFNISSQNINLLATKKNKNYVSKGNDISFNSMINFIQNNNLSVEHNYHYIKKQLDIKSFINYFTLQIYISNIDWLHNNTKYWKEKTNDSKWRWILYDTDYGFGLKSGYNQSDVNYNTLQNFLINENSSTGQVYNALIRNEDFKENFIYKFYTLLDTTFQPENINNKIKKLTNKIAPEIPRHLKKWFGDERTYKDWEMSVDELYDYSNARNEIVKEQLEELF
jgi:hypothetical protein